MTEGANTMIRVSQVCPAAPGGRFREFGPGSGEEFRDDILRPALTQGNGQVTVILDSRRGFGSSFLDEAFAGLIHKGYFSGETVKQRLRIKGEGALNELAAKRALEFIDEAISYSAA